MKRKILITIYVILICITIKFAYNIVINSILISKYQNGEYSEGLANALTTFNFPQKYVANYNYGNILYQKGEYEKAIEEYKIALKGNAPTYKECSIRINYALAICKTVQVNEKDKDSVNNAIKTYESAIDVLTEDGCANKNDNNGHSQKAEKLKKDIQKEIDRLKNLQKQNQGQNDDQKDEEQEEEQKKEKDTVEEKMQEIKEQATQKQRETEEMYKQREPKDWNNEKNW